MDLTKLSNDEISAMAVTLKDGGTVDTSSMNPVFYADMWFLWNSFVQEVGLFELAVNTKAKEMLGEFFMERMLLEESFIQGVTEDGEE